MLGQTCRMLGQSCRMLRQLIGLAGQCSSLLALLGMFPSADGTPEGFGRRPRAPPSKARDAKVPAISLELGEGQFPLEEERDDLGVSPGVERRLKGRERAAAAECHR